LKNLVDAALSEAEKVHFCIEEQYIEHIDDLDESDVRIEIYARFDVQFRNVLN
jgi:LEA14-like dessication related protein